MEFYQYADACGLIITKLQSGRICRCATKEHPHKRNGAYYYDGDWGWVQDWATMPDIQHWQTDKVMSSRERLDMQVRMERQKAEQKKEKMRLNIEAAQKAVDILKKCKVDNHAYLKNKGFPDAKLYTIEIEGQHKLCIPMKFKGQTSGLQIIDEDGSKKFLYGQRTNYTTYNIGDKGLVIACEGYATGLSIKSVLGALKILNTVKVCFSAGNLTKIAKQAECLVIADNDKSGTGERCAIESGRRFWMPPNVGEDFNDMWQMDGKFKASQIIRNFIYG